MFKSHDLKSTKNPTRKIKQKNMRTFHVQLLFQTATEMHLTHSVITKVAPFNSSGECTFEKKLKKRLECYWRKRNISKQKETKRN